MEELVQQLEKTGLCWSIGSDRLGLTCRIFSKPQGATRFCIIEQGRTLEEAVTAALSRYAQERKK